MSTARKDMQPGLPLFLPPRNLWTCAVDGNLHMLPVKNLGGESGGNISFNAEPFVREIGNGGLEANRAGIKNRRTKAHPGYGQAELPAVIVAAAINKLRFG